MATRGRRKRPRLDKEFDIIDQAIGNVRDLRRDTEYVVTGAINAKDVHGLGLKLLNDRTLRREYSSLALLPNRPRDVLYGYSRPNSLFVLQIASSGRFGLGVKIIADPSDFLSSPRIQLNRERSQLTLGLIPFMIFGYIGRQVSLTVLRAMFKRLKIKNDFAISGIEFPGLRFSHALRTEASEIQRRVMRNFNAR
jgi:hypothetical protein